MKITVSLPDELFQRADDAVSRLGLNRSQLYAKAVEQFLEPIGEDSVTAALDELADELHTEVGADAGRHLIERGAWECGGWISGSRPARLPGTGVLLWSSRPIG